MQLFFRGVRPSPSSLYLTGGQRVSPPVRVYSLLSSSDILPSASLDRYRTVIKPNGGASIRPLSDERDSLVSTNTSCGDVASVLYEIVLEYEFEQAESGDILPRWPGLQGVLYESNYHSQVSVILLK